MAERRVFDQRDVEVAETRAAKGIAAEHSEASLVWPGASGNVDRNIEERRIVRPSSEVVSAVAAARRKVWLLNQVRTVSSTSPHTSLLNSRKNGERRSAG